MKTKNTLTQDVLQCDQLPSQSMSGARVTMGARRVLVSAERTWPPTVTSMVSPASCRVACVVRDANMGHQLAGGHSSWCLELGYRTTHQH